LVRIVSLRAEGFRRLQIREPLVFPEGLIVIRGRNEAGKSTILEAILFGLYGDFRLPAALRGGRQGLESIVNHRAGRARVEVTFEVGGRRYRVERVVEADREGGRQVDAKLVELSDGGARLLATGVSRVNEMVQKLLRVSWREMLATNVIAQKDLERILRMDRGDRERIINMMMGFESYNKAVERLSEEARGLRRDLEAVRKELEALAERVRELEEKERRLGEWEGELAKLEGELPRLEAEVERERAVCSYLRELEGALRRKRELRQRIEELRGEAERLGEELRRAAERLGAARRELEELKAKRAAALEELRGAEEELRRIEDEAGRLVRLEARLKELYSSYRSTLGELEGARARAAELLKRVEGIGALSAEKRGLEGELSRVEGALSAAPVPRWALAAAAALFALAFVKPPATTLLALAAAAPLAALLARRWLRRRALAAAAERLRRRLLEVEAELKLLERDRGELEELREREAALERRAEELRAELSALAAEVELGAGSYEELAARAAKLAGEAEARRGEALERVRRLEKALAGAEEAIRARERELAELEARAAELGAKLAEVEGELRRAEGEYAGLALPEPPPQVAGALQPLGEDLEEVSKLRAEHEGLYESLRAELERARGRVDELRRVIGETRRELQRLPELKARLGELEGRARSLELEVGAREVAIDALRRVAERRRAAFAPSVEANMSWVVSYITGGRYKAVRIDPQTYDIEVFDAEAGRWMRRDIYSGGTNDQFLLAMRIAFTLSLLPAAKGAYPRFLFLDEPLGSSDAERRGWIVELLARELTRFFDQIFLVTHVEIEEPPGSTVILIDEGSVQRVYRVGAGEAAAE